jgi:hypothetical protein
MTRLALLLLALAAGTAQAQTSKVLACESPWGAANRCGGCDGLRWTTPTASTYVWRALGATSDDQYWRRYSEVAAGEYLATSTTMPPLAAITSCPLDRLVTKAEFEGGSAPTPPPPPPPPTSSGTGSLTFNWAAATVNTDGSPINPPVTYRLTVSGVVRVTTAALTHTVTGLAAGQHCGTIATISAGGTSAETNPACGTVVVASTCGAKPADDTQTAQCTAPLVGSWAQTRTYQSAPYPTCWTAGAWTPASAPAGACVAVPAEPAVIAVALGVNASPIFGITATGARGTTVLGFVPVGKPCTGPVVYSYRGIGYRRFALSDAIWWQSTPTNNAAAACR